MKIIRIPGNSDGNCLFRSCAYHLGIDYRKLRRQVTRFIRKHRDLEVNGSTVREWIKMAGHCPRDYHEHMSKDGIYGTGIELMIISLIYRRTIIVCKERKTYFEEIIEYFPEFGNKFYLLFSGSPNSGHYDPLE